jgi:hypothetical protein
MGDVLFGEDLGDHGLERPQLVDAVEVVDLEGFDGAVGVLLDDEQVEQSDRARVDQGRQLGGYLAAEGGVTGGELDDEEVDRVASPTSAGSGRAVTTGRCGGGASEQPRGMLQWPRFLAWSPSTGTWPRRLP